MRGYRGQGRRPGTGGGGRPGTGRGMGNPYPFCRLYPWLPRRWWAYGMTPYGPTAQGSYNQPTPNPNMAWFS